MEDKHGEMGLPELAVRNLSGDVILEVREEECRTAGELRAKLGVGRLLFEDQILSDNDGMEEVLLRSSCREFVFVPRAPPPDGYFRVEVQDANGQPIDFFSDDLRGRQFVGELSCLGTVVDADAVEMPISAFRHIGDEGSNGRKPRRGCVNNLLHYLSKATEKHNIGDLVFRGRTLQHHDRFEQVLFNDDSRIIHLVQKSAPKDGFQPVSWDNDDCSDDGYRDPNDTCFTSDCEVQVLDVNGKEVTRFMKELSEGDVVKTGASVAAHSYRRVTKIWPCRINSRVSIVRLSAGCRLTTGHPVFTSNRWWKPEHLKQPQQIFEDTVYTLELEGHIDTILVGGVVCAALGVYCGEDFGWNVFTRKTVPCDRQHCAKCKKAIIKGINFSAIDKKMIEQRYPPY